VIVLANPLPIYENRNQGFRVLVVRGGADYAEMQVRKDTELDCKLVARIRLFYFGAKRAVKATVTYPIDFFSG